MIDSIKCKFWAEISHTQRKKSPRHFVIFQSKPAKIRPLCQTCIHDLRCNSIKARTLPLTMPSHDDLPNGTESTPSPSISVKGLSYAFQDGSLGLQDINLTLPAGSRTLL